MRSVTMPCAGSAPQPVDPDRGPWPLHDAAASRAIEHAALAMVAPHALMERAGLAVARLALAVAPHAHHIRLWCGPGNNGGDGLVAARRLLAAGKAVDVVLAADPARLPRDAAQALGDAQAAGVRITEGALPPLGPDGLAVDALLGIGSHRAPEGAVANAITAINAAAAPVVAVDLPSGLHPDTGALLGGDAVRATATLALLTLKPGCHTASGRDHAGRVWLDRLGVDEALWSSTTPTAWLAAAPARRPRFHATHKGRYGDVAVVGGATGMTGAAVLAARAAIAAGAGRVFCSLLEDHGPAFDVRRPELMFRPRWWRQPPDAIGAATVVCGCGGGDAVREALPPLLAHAARLVLDADALNAVADDASLGDLLLRRGRRGAPTLLTPHPLEAARLLGCSASDVQHDRIAAARTLAARLGGVAVLLKGSGSVIAAGADGPVTINPTGNASLASAGTGDVLAGWAGGCWAQRQQAGAGEIATAAAWEHGRAADRWPGAAHGVPLLASDLIDALARWG